MRLAGGLARGCIALPLVDGGCFTHPHLEARSAPHQEPLQSLSDAGRGDAVGNDGQRYEGHDVAAAGLQQQKWRHGRAHRSNGSRAAGYRLRGRWRRWQRRPWSPVKAYPGHIECPVLHAVAMALSADTSKKHTLVMSPRA